MLSKEARFQTQDPSIPYLANRTNELTVKMDTITKQAAIALVTLFALTSFCSLEGKPVEASLSEKEVVEVRGMVFDPTAETGEFII